MFFGVIALIAAWFLGALAMPWSQRERDRPGRKFSEQPVGATLHPVVIHQPDGPPMVDSGKRDSRGRPVMVDCATCHDTRDPDFTSNTGAALTEFHRGLQYSHGEQSCLTCHHAGDYGSLKLADGRRLDFSESMRLCAQCHGPQFRDYQNGSHGGMTGYWDLRQGPRERNHCIDCHDSHHPAYPQVIPVFPPGPAERAGETHPH